jgi:molecular chaperone HscA
VAECLPDVEGHVILPSAVRYLENDGRQIGRALWRRKSEDPQNTLVSVKRFMGRGVADIANRDQLPYVFDR